MLSFLKGPSPLPGLHIDVARNGFILTIRPRSLPPGTIGKTIATLLANFSGKLPEELNLFQQQPENEPAAEDVIDSSGVAPPPGSPEAAFHRLNQQVAGALAPFEKLAEGGEEQTFVFPDAVQLLDFLSELLLPPQHPEMQDAPGGHSLEGEGGYPPPPPSDAEFPPPRYPGVDDGDESDDEGEGPDAT